ncbi:MAG: DUF547 domain-containing protein [Pseudomonadota bacterium]
MTGQARIGRARIRRIAGAALLLALGACTAIERAALPAPVLTDPGWASYSPGSPRRVDHAAWDRFLATYRRLGSDGIARIDYAAVTPQDHAALKAYVAALGAEDVAALDRPAQLAFWINLYNAVTVDLVLDAYPVDSIRTVGAGLLPTGPWDAPVVTVGDKPLSLNDIEHAIVRPIWQDARVHYAFNCAAAGCPNLGETAYRGATVEALLDRNARAYVNDPRGLRDEDGRLVASRIYAWFREDFGGSDAGVLAHARRYAELPLAARLRGATRIDRFAYDWTLNDTANGPGAVR